MDKIINEWLLDDNLDLELNLSNLKLTSLKLPFTTVLKELNCDNNLLNSLPNLPDSLIKLSCIENKLTELSNLPFGLNILNCDNNLLTGLPELSNSLKYLSCSYNLLTELPSLLHTDLERLHCYNNSLTELPPDLPLSLIVLYCDNNLLTSLPCMSTLKFLSCDNNPFLYNRINIIKQFPNHNIFNYKYAFSNYKILLKLQHKYRKIDI